MVVPEPVPDSFPESSRASLSSVWFAGTTPDDTLSAENSLINVVLGAASSISEAFGGPLDFLVREAILPENATFSRSNTRNEGFGHEGRLTKILEAVPKTK